MWDLLTKELGRFPGFLKIELFQTRIMFMDKPNIWDHQHNNFENKAITYQVELLSYKNSNPIEFEITRKRFDIGIEVFLDLFNIAKRNHATVELEGHTYLINLYYNNKITIQKLNNLPVESGSVNLIGRW